MVSIFIETYVETIKNANLHIGYKNERIFFIKILLTIKSNLRVRVRTQFKTKMDNYSVKRYCKHIKLIKL
jgi:hypothetical protein